MKMRREVAGGGFGRTKRSLPQFYSPGAKPVVFGIMGIFRPFLIGAIVFESPAW
jgi:hypothetical protein